MCIESVDVSIVNTSSKFLVCSATKKLLPFELVESLNAHPTCLLKFQSVIFHSKMYDFQCLFCRLQKMLPSLF